MLRPGAHRAVPVTQRVTCDIMSQHLHHNPSFLLISTSAPHLDHLYPILYTPEHILE
jgi:hypothetical protein